MCEQKHKEQKSQETDNFLSHSLISQEPSLGNKLSPSEEEQSLTGELPRECSPEITNPFTAGEKVFFTEDISDCGVTKGDCGEVVSLMKNNLVLVRKNNLDTEIKVDQNCIKQATIYQVAFSTGICGFGVIPGARNKNAFVGPTLQSEHAKRTVIS